MSKSRGGLSTTKTCQININKTQEGKLASHEVWLLQLRSKQLIVYSYPESFIYNCIALRIPMRWEVANAATLEQKHDHPCPRALPCMQPAACTQSQVFQSILIKQTSWMNRTSSPHTSNHMFSIAHLCVVKRIHQSIHSRSRVQLVLQSMILRALVAVVVADAVTEDHPVSAHVGRRDIY